MHINKWVPRRLWQQIFLIILGLVVIPIVVLATLLINTSQKTIESMVNRDLKQILLHATGEVLKEYEGAYHALDATAAILGTLHADAWRQETALVQLSLKYKAFRHVCSLDTEGNMIACSDLGESMAKKNKVDLTCIMQQEQCISKVRIAKDHVPVIDILVPVRKYGKIQGALIAEYNLRGIWDVMDKISFGHRSRAILIDQFGRILAHPDKKEVLKNNTLDYPEVVSDLDQGKSDVRIVMDKMKSQWVMAYAPIPTLGWGLIVAQPYQDAFALVRVTYQHSWVAVILGILAACIVGLIIAQWMSRPIESIIQATKQLAKGDLSVSLPIHRRDEIGRLKYAFNHMIVELKKARELERLSIVGKSAASIAHELKNSLTLIKTCVQLMPHRHKDKAFVKEASETVAKELDNWNDMLRNIRDFANEQMPLRFSPTDINALVDEIMVLTRLKAESQQINFAVELCKELGKVMADQNKIKQVLVNLIGNAFEATPEGGEVIVRTLSVDGVPRPFIGFEVINSGKGIAPENLTKIFTPFFTTKETGLGLGLAICQDIIRKHDGRLEVSSVTGQGTIFRVLLPEQKKVLQRGVYDFRENSYR